MCHLNRRNCSIFSSAVVWRQSGTHTWMRLRKFCFATVFGTQKKERCMRMAKICHRCEYFHVIYGLVGILMALQMWRMKLIDRKRTTKKESLISKIFYRLCGRVWLFTAHEMFASARSIYDYDNWSLRLAMRCREMKKKQLGDYRNLHRWHINILPMKCFLIKICLRLNGQKMDTSSFLLRMVAYY